MAAFDSVGIDARFDEDTPDAACATKVQAWDALDGETKTGSHGSLDGGRPAAEHAATAGEAIGKRRINRVVVLPLHGTPFTWETVDAAIGFIEAYSETDHAPKPVARYEIQIRYDNDDSIRGEFVNKEGAVSFLRTSAPRCGLRPRMRLDGTPSRRWMGINGITFVSYYLYS